MEYEIVLVVSLDDLGELFNEYLTSRPRIKTEMYEQIKTKYSANLKSGAVLMLCLLEDNKPIGFITGKSKNAILDIISYHVTSNKHNHNCLYKLFTAISDKAFVLGNKVIRSFQVHTDIDANIEEKFRDGGFEVYYRNSMHLKLEEDSEYPIILPEGYKFESFSLDDLEKYLQIILDSNNDNIDQKIILEFSAIEATKDILLGMTNNYTQILSCSPQLIFEDKIVGISILIDLGNPSSSYVWDISLNPEHRGKGLGKAIMKQIANVCLAEGRNSIFLDVTEENSIAYNLYRKLNYIQDKRYMTVIKRKRAL